MSNQSDTAQRLFFSLKFTAMQQQLLLPYQRVLQQKYPAAKAVAVDNLHLTLFFLGQVTAEQKQLLVAAAKSIAMPSFELTLDTVASFSKPKILCLAPSVVARELLVLQRQVADICKAMGFNEIHDGYRPHVTLMRHASVPQGFTQQVLPLSIAVSEFALYQSLNIDGAVRYLPLHTFSSREG